MKLRTANRLRTALLAATLVILATFATAHNYIEPWTSFYAVFVEQVQVGETTANGGLYKSTIVAGNLSGDVTHTLPTSSGTLAQVDGSNPTAIPTTLTTNAVGVANSIWGGTSQVIAEGTTADAHETTISFPDVTADQTASIPNIGAAFAFMSSSLTTNAPDAANSVTGTSNGMLYEGATADGSETTITPTDPTADRTVTLPDASGTVPLFQASFSATKAYVATDAVASGQTSKAVTVTGITTAAKCSATLTEVATNSVSVRAAVPTANTLTVTLSGDPGASGADLCVICFE